MIVRPYLPMLVLIALGLSGCAERRPQRAPARPAPAQKPAVPLANWAPKNPSPEFVRAARVLTSMAERPAQSDQPESDLAARAASARYTRTLPAAWEFFGTLSDGQVERFLATRELRLQVKDLSPKQRAALYRYFEVWREQMKGLPERPTEWGADWLVDLYKFGAREDLSNVQIEFLVRGSARVAMILRVRQPDGGLSPRLPAGLGDLAERVERKPK